MLLAITVMSKIATYFDLESAWVLGSDNMDLIIKQRQEEAAAVWGS
jgi:hypothetical protein